MKKQDRDFREQFSQMATQAVITRAEFAALLATTEGAITQMTYRGELPQTAFPSKRRACWFVGDVRNWLDCAAASRSTQEQTQANELTSPTRKGRPRLPTNDRIGA